MAVPDHRLRFLYGRAAALLLLQLLPWAEVGGGSAPDSYVRNQHKFLSGERERAAAWFQNGRYHESADLFEWCYWEARRARALPEAARTLNSSGAARLASFDYAKAFWAFRESRRLAQKQEDWDLISAISVNLASLELQVGDLEGARGDSRRALEAIDHSPRPSHRAEALVLAAKIEAADRGINAAEPLYRAALAEADRSDGTALLARIWNQIGWEYLNAGRTGQAETAITEAFRLRTLNARGELPQSYQALGLLRLAQGDTDSALRFLTRALEMARMAPGRVPLWANYHARGRAWMARGEPGKALNEFRSALEDARRWRLRIPPIQAVRKTAEAGLNQVCSAFVEAAVEEYRNSKHSSLLREAFEVSEECRAAGLESRLAEAWRANWKPGRLVEGIQSRLPRSAALFSFRLGEPRSSLWVVTRDRFTWYPLAGREELMHVAAQFRESALGGSEDTPRRGTAAFRALFGGDTIGKRQWLIEADPALAGLPFSALARESDARPRFLIEEHSIEQIPIAPYTFPPAGAPAGAAMRFVGVGDPVYNSADPRCPQLGESSDAAELPRLTGSHREVLACARAWGADSVVLEGASASRRSLLQVLKRGLRVLHFATHVVRASEPPNRSAIALSLAAPGVPELLRPEEIANWNLPASALVALSGCASGAPGRASRSYRLSVAPHAADAAGQARLAHSWLAAGAGAVAATLWSVPDDNGGLFVEFYRRLGNGEEPADALRAAQIAALSSGGWRSSPRYWAAYFLMARR